jgi:hypothetical protein
MSKTFGGQIRTLYFYYNTHDDPESRAERRLHMPVNTDFFLDVAPDDSVTVRLVLVAPHPEIAQLVRDHGGTVTESPTTTLVAFPLTDCDRPFICKFCTAMGLEEKARSEQNSADIPGWDEGATRVGMCFFVLADFIEVYRNERDQARERAERTNKLKRRGRNNESK